MNPNNFQPPPFEDYVHPGLWTGADQMPMLPLMPPPPQQMAMLLAPPAPILVPPPVAPVAPAALRACPLSPACAAQIPYCIPVSVFKYNGKVRRAAGWTADGRLRLAEVVADAVQCLVTGHYSARHENDSHRVCQRCRKSAGYVCLIHVAELPAAPHEHLCTRCAARNAATETDRSRARLGDTRFSRGQASRISNLQQHITGESHCGLMHYMCETCPETRTGGFVTKSDYSNHVKSNDHKENSRNVIIVEVADDGEDAAGWADPFAPGTPLTPMHTPLSASRNWADRAGSEGYTSSEWENSSADQEAPTPPISAPPSPAWQAGASPFVLNKVDPVLYEAASNLKVTNPLDDKQSEPSISNPLSETSSGQQSASLSQLSVSELVGENDRWKLP